MSKASEKREQARLRAERSRASARVKHDLDAAVADAVASLVGEQGKGDVPVHHLCWRLVVEGTYEGLRERGYDREDAVTMTRFRLIPNAPGSPPDLVGVIETL